MLNLVYRHHQLNNRHVHYSIPYDYRMSQMWVEGTLGIVPELAPKIMLNEEGENITLSDNIAMFTKWANRKCDSNVCGELQPSHSQQYKRC